VLQSGFGGASVRKPPTGTAQWLLKEVGEPQSGAAFTWPITAFTSLIDRGLDKKNYQKFVSNTPPPLSGEPQVQDALEITFGLERDLQTALRKNIEQLEHGLKIIDGGKEQRVAAGYIDITAEDEHGNTVVIELKARFSRGLEASCRWHKRSLQNHEAGIGRPTPALF
jgi:hypothetical protein